MRFFKYRLKWDSTLSKQRRIPLHWKILGLFQIGFLITYLSSQYNTNEYEKKN